MKKMKFQWKLETKFGHVDVKGHFYIQLFQSSQKSSGLGSFASRQAMLVTIVILNSQFAEFDCIVLCKGQ